MRKLLACLCVIACLGGARAISAEPITVVADEWPPFSGSSLPGEGISIDVTRAVLTRAGYDVETAILPWARVVHGAKRGEYDIVTSLFPDPEMQEALLYSAPFFATEVKFVKRKESPIVFDGLRSLIPYSIAVGAGFLYEPAFDNAQFLTKLEVTTALQGIRMVAAGHADLTLDSTDVINHSIRLGAPDLANEIEFVDPPLIRQNIHMAVSRKHPDHVAIVADFNRVLREMQADGSFAALLEKHQLN